MSGVGQGSRPGLLNSLGYPVCSWPAKSPREGYAAAAQEVQG